MSCWAIPKTLFSSATPFQPIRADIGGSWFELNGAVSAPHALAVPQHQRTSGASTATARRGMRGVA
jgi:hypothetical protein